MIADDIQQQIFIALSLTTHARVTTVSKLSRNPCPHRTVFNRVVLAMSRLVYWRRGWKQGDHFGCHCKILTRDYHGLDKAGNW